MCRRLALLALVVFAPVRAPAQSSFEDLIAASKAIPQAPVHVDLSWQFPGPPRQQGDIGSCHAFAAVALTEAAYYRHYGRRLRLSEADLFLRKRVLPDPLLTLRSREGSLLRPDLRWLLKHGVMPGDFYAAFAARYPAFKSRAFKFLEKKNKIVAELLPESTTDEANAAREKVRTELAGFTAAGQSFLKFAGAIARGTLDRGPVGCDEKRVAGLLERQLNAGRPVGVGMNTGWADRAVWRRDAEGKGGSHYFVVTGYDRGIDGIVFRTRNTWTDEAGGSPTLYGQDLCAIYGMSWLRSPSDAP